MTCAALTFHPRPARPASWWGTGLPPATHGPADVVFAALPRSDQRRRAREYLTGLLSTTGRRTMRNIAALFGGPATEQGLNHFISGSTWDWLPLRQALANAVETVVKPRAWVVRSLLIPKSGRYSVGVDRHFLPGAGQQVYGQHAYVLWSAGLAASVPVDWRLFLPASWLAEPARRRRVGIPDDMEEETPNECATRAALTAIERWRLPVRPVLLDLWLSGLRPVIGQFRAARVPVMARVSGTEPLEVAEPTLPGYRAGALVAQRILESVRGIRRKVSWMDSVAGMPVVRSSTVASVPVRFPSAHGRGGLGTGPLLLVGEWRDRHRAPTELWLTTLTDASLGTLAALTRTSHRITRDSRQHAETLGMLDFEGRSFAGWHRHLTLVSLAHATAVWPEALAAAGGTYERVRPDWRRPGCRPLR